MTPVLEFVLILSFMEVKSYLMTPPMRFNADCFCLSRQRAVAVRARVTNVVVFACIQSHAGCDICTFPLLPQLSTSMCDDAKALHRDPWRL